MLLPVFLTTCLPSHLRLLMDNFLKKSLASFLHIPPGRIEIAGVPRIGYLAGTIGKIHQKMHLAGRIAAADALHISQVGMIHANQEVVFFVVAFQQLAGSLAGAVDAMLGQLAASRRIHRIANLLGAGRCRFDLKSLLQPGFLHQILHNELGHRTSANVAVAEEKYPDHALNTPICCLHIQYSMEPLIRREELPDGPLPQLFLRRSTRIAGQYANTIGKSSVENVIKKLIEEGVLVKHGTGRAACCRKSDAEQAIDAHERWYLVYGRLPRKFPNKRRFPTKTNLINR